MNLVFSVIEVETVMTIKTENNPATDFECLIGSKRPVYTSQLQYSVKVATSSYTVQLKYVLVYPGSYISKVGL